MLGEKLGAYRIERELGTGGMGKVYAATLRGRAPGLSEGDLVALKLVHPHLLETEGFFMRFMREAALGASIQHDNVVRTHLCDQIIVNGTPHAFLVMEYVEGRTLRELVQELEQVPEELCRHVATEICSGLVAIHAAGVVHRDLKPENVLITPEHQVKVMDLGVARLADEAMRLSQSGAFIGSVEYAAPEQFGNGLMDARIDVHALGLILYEIATGQHPYRADGFREVMRRVCADEPRRLGEINPQLSPFFEELVHTMLAKSPDDRFADAEELLAILHEGEDSAWWGERAKALRDATKRPLRRIRIPRETAVYGRDDELARLRSLFEAAQAGNGQVVVIEGEAGIGKSRIVDELVVRLLKDGQDLNFLFGSYPPGGAASAAGAFSTAFREQFGQAGCAEYLTQTPLLVPSFDALLQGDATPTGAQPLTQDSVATCFAHAARNLAAERPTVILIDDLHFAPEEARSLFSALALSIESHAVVLVGTTRPGTDDEWRAGLTRLDHATHMTLDRLGPKDLAMLLKDTFQSELLAQQLGHQVAIKSDGNPFFVFEIIRGLREGKFITQSDDGTWASTQVIQDIAIPSSVLDLVNARVADLGDEERNLLDVAACWGYEFDATLVGEALGLRRLPVLQTMAKIEKRDRLVRASGRQFVFDHHQVQEALYGALPEMLREEYHFALAEVLESRTMAADADVETLDGALCVDLCEHFLASAQAERALRYLDTAIEHLIDGYLFAEVIRLADRALAAPEGLAGTRRVELLIRQSKWLNYRADIDRAVACAREATAVADRSDDVLCRARARLQLGALLFYGDVPPDEAMVELDRARELAVEAGDEDLEVAVCATRVQGLVRHRRDDEALELAQQLHPRVQAAPDSENALRIEGLLGTLRGRQGRWDEARRHTETVLDAHIASGNVRGEVSRLGYLAWISASEGRWDEHQRHARRALARSQEIGARRTEADARMRVAFAQAVQGELARAYDALPVAREALREVGDLDHAEWCELELARLDTRFGDYDGAVARIDRVRLDERPQRAEHVDGYALSLLASHANERGDFETEIDLRRQEVELTRRDSDPDAIAGSLVSLAYSCHAGGERDAAMDAFAEASALSAASRRPARRVWRRVISALLEPENAELVKAAEDDLAASTAFLPVLTRMACHQNLWKITNKPEHIAEAKSLLDLLVANSPSEHCASMLTDVREHREIVEAWRSAFGDDGDGPKDTESITQAG
jgi:serine/threonine protein kinase/tetratricopeptide (TPR) repeat protein